MSQNLNTVLCLLKPLKLHCFKLLLFSSQLPKLLLLDRNMQFFRAASGSGGGAGGAGGWISMAVRHFSRKRAEDVRRINPKVPKEEAIEISKGLLQIVKDHGPLTTSDTWNRVKDAGISGVNSKTHMKLLLKWMRGRRMLKLTCAHIGNSKKFYYSSKTEEDSLTVPVFETIKKAGPLSPKKGRKRIKQ